MLCSICGCEFDLETEGGISGDIGILAVAFCPTCWNGLRDAFDYEKDCKHGIDCPVCAEEDEDA
jgi:hypothetical protein